MDFGRHDQPSETKLMKAAAGLAVLTLLLSTGNVVAGPFETGTIPTSRQHVLVAQQLLPGGSPPQDPAAIKVEKDPMVERWKHEEVRRLDGGATETVIIERVMIAAASVVVLLILGKLAFPS